MLLLQERTQGTSSLDSPSASSSLQEGMLLEVSLVGPSTLQLLLALMSQVQVLVLAGALLMQDTNSLELHSPLPCSESSVQTSLEARASMDLEPNSAASSLEHSTSCSQLV